MATPPAPPLPPLARHGLWTHTAVYTAIAYAVAWIAWAPLILGQNGLKWIAATPSMPIFISLGTLGPALACFLTHRLTTGNWRAVRLLPPLGPKWIWFVLGPLLLLPCFFLLFPLLIAAPSSCPWWTRTHLLTGLPAVIFSYNLFGGPLFEEFGWRGYLQARLQRDLAPWLASLCVGLIWATWHLPLFLLTNWNNGPLLAYYATCTALAILIALAFNASGGSVAVAILMHAVFNSSPRFLGAYLDNCDIRGWLTGESFIAASFLIPALIALALTRAKLAHPPRLTQSA